MRGAKEGMTPRTIFSIVLASRINAVMRWESIVMQITGNAPTLFFLGVEQFGHQILQLDSV